MPASSLELIDVFRNLASFEPARIDLTHAPWDKYTDWAIAQGLAPLAAHNLEYRLGPKAGAPQWVRDRLLSIYQGSVNDNVMKLVNFKRSVDDLEGRRMLMLGAAVFAESLYPHVAFRPVIDLHLVLRAADLDPFIGYLKRADFKPSKEKFDDGTMITDGRTNILLSTQLLHIAGEDERLMERAQALKVYGPSFRRLELEDALVVHALLMARAGFAVPMIEWVDLRELVLGAPMMGGAYSRAPKAELVLERAASWKCERGLWTALSTVAKLFPETERAVEAMKPSLSFPVRELLTRVIVDPVADVSRMHVFRGEEAVRTLLAGD